jgi:hypothetical protein
MLNATMLLAGALVTLTSVGAARAEPVAAGHGASSPDAPAATSLDLSLHLGARGFRLGGRLLGHGGYAGGAWLNGEARGDGFRLDGGLEHGGSRHDFTLDADLGDWLWRAKRAGGVTGL